MIQSDDVLSIFAHWQQILDHPRAKLDAKRRNVIGERLKDGYTAEDLKLAIEGCACSPYHMAQDERNTTTIYDSITLILRDADHVDKFMKIGEQARRIIEQMQKNKEAVQTTVVIPAAPPTPEQIARARAAIKSGMRARLQ